MRERYQPEIDGLRAIAIVPVVFYHAGWTLFRRGFIGVDIFFVISGFLISRLLLTELRATGAIDFAAFYARRVRRLFPALATVVVAVLILGTFLLSAVGERQELSKSAVATMGFVANIYFWRMQASYFAQPTDWVALVNMWTLSVEEQFYLLWPLALMLMALFARRIGRSATATLGVLLVVVFAVSIAIFHWGARAEPTATFYLAPPRAWEFALGAALALVERTLQARRQVGPWAAWLGLALIAVTVINAGGLFNFVNSVVAASFATALTIVGLTAAPLACPAIGGDAARRFTAHWRCGNRAFDERLPAAVARFLWPRPIADPLRPLQRRGPGRIASTRECRRDRHSASFARLWPSVARRSGLGRVARQPARYP